ncbi:MAG: DNA recombination protein RmuC [Bacteroidales bacterium]|jgi:DNA recombination protein RmuC|nr:DNA recombination protein RmuC [Bacteroidales bacterium]
MDIVFLIIGLVIGGVAVWFVKPSKVGTLQEEVEKKYVPLNIYESERQERERISAMASDLKSKLSVAEEKMATLKNEIESVQATFRNEFKNLANELLEEKSKKFVELNEKNIGTILNPLKDKLEKFEKKVDETYSNETREKASLRTELKHIIEANRTLSDEAQRLTKALKGDSKVQGDWGEVQLEILLEKSGLQRGIHFVPQANYKTEEGNNVRPDYIINLPENKNFIIDCKASLKAYEGYFNAENEADRERFLDEHLLSIRNHINELGDKKYHKLYGINAPDFVFLFVPVEPALTIAFQNDSELYDKALRKNIILVSSSTLLATMRTVAFIWRADDQKRHVLEIAKESGSLYDKFVGFIEDLIKVGKEIDTAKEEYTKAMNKLTTSTRRGDTIVGRIENLKKLGASATKSIPPKLLERVDDNLTEADSDLETSDNNALFPSSEL